MTLELVISCMFSGKTTLLLNRLNTFALTNVRCLYVNSSLDTRGEIFSTHNPLITSLGSISALKLDTLSPLLNEDYDVIGIDEAQVDALFLGLGPQCMRPARRMDRHRVEEALGHHLIAEALHRGGEDLRHAMGALGHFPDALGPVVDGEHRGDDGQQHLCGANVARGLLAANVLFARLQGQAICGAAVRVHRDANKSTWE